MSISHFLTFVFFVLGLSSVHAQNEGRERLNVIHLLNFSDTVENYNFSFQKNNQGIYFGKLPRTGKYRATELKIYNHSRDTIFIKKFHSSDGSVNWVPKDPLSKEIPPESTFTIQGYWHDRLGPFSRTITLQFLQANQSKNLFIQTWGEIQDKQPEPTNKSVHFDTLNYSEYQQFYFTELEGKNGMIYFNYARYDNNRPITVLLINNTTDTISLQIKSLMSSKMYIKEQTGRSIAPGEYYSFSPIFNQERYRKSPLLDAHFAFQYSAAELASKPYVMRFRGTIILEDLLPFGTEVSPIATTEFQEHLFLIDDTRLSKKRIQNDTLKTPYTVSKGKFIGSDLYSGEIQYYNSKDELIVSKRVEKRVEQEGFIYKGEQFNLNDSLGRKEGKWISLRNAKTVLHKIDAYQLYDGFWHILSYHAGERIDTAYFYHETGILNMTFVSGHDTTPPERTYYHANGSISQIDFFKTDKKYEFIIYKSLHYSDSLKGCITKRDTYFPNQQKIDFTYEYVDCQLFSKTSVKEQYFQPKPQTITHRETNVHEGRTETITFEEEMMSIPVLRPIPYTVEIGSFDPSEIDLVNGTISYHEANGTLIKTKNVRNGVIID